MSSSAASVGMTRLQYQAIPGVLRDTTLRVQAVTRDQKACAGQIGRLMERLEGITAGVAQVMDKQEVRH
jgi:hypothetical protein